MPKRELLHDIIGHWQHSCGLHSVNCSLCITSMQLHMKPVMLKISLLVCLLSGMDLRVNNL